MDYFTGTIGEEDHRGLQDQKKWKLWIWYAVGCAVVVIVTLFIVNGGEDKEDTQSEAHLPTAFTSRPRAPLPSAVAPALRSPFTVDDPVRGSTGALVAIVEFSDFECPFCAQASPIIQAVMAQYAGKVLFQYRDFPIVDVHPNAVRAAEAAECASEQGKFWEYHDLLFDNLGELSREGLTRYALVAGLTLPEFNACLDGRQKINEVNGDVQDGVALGVNGTPTFFINGVQYEGVLSEEEFIDIIEGLLGQRR